MARLLVFIGVTCFVSVGCVSMTTIQARNPIKEWHIAGNYDTVAFCILDKFEAGKSMFTKMVALDFRNRTDRREATIQGSAKADRNFGIFELKTQQVSDGVTLVQLRGVNDPSTTAAYKVVEECSTHHL
jgi:hypothetical protein